MKCSEAANGLGESGQARGGDVFPGHVKVEKLARAAPSKLPFREWSAGANVGKLAEKRENSYGKDTHHFLQEMRSPHEARMSPMESPVPVVSDTWSHQGD